MEALWQKDIRDDDLEAVSELFRRNGFQWHLDKLGDDGMYNKAPGLEYCGHTVAVAGLNMDPPLSPPLCRGVLPSTYRLGSKKHWKKAGFDRDEARTDEIVRGAICIIQDRHIVVSLEIPKKGQFETIEGNAVGEFPDGSKGKGVVRRFRATSEVTDCFVLWHEHRQ